MAKDKDEKEEKEVVYVLNNSFISHEMLGTVFPKKKFVAVSKDQLKELKTVPMFNSLLNTKDFEIKEEIDDSMRTTEEKLSLAKNEAVALKKEAEEIKAEALQALSEKDKEIEELKAKLAALNSEGK